MIWFVCLALAAAGVGVYRVGTIPLSGRPRLARSTTRVAVGVFVTMCLLAVGYAVTATL